MSDSALREAAQHLVDAIRMSDEANIHGWSHAVRAALSAEPHECEHRLNTPCRVRASDGWCATHRSPFPAARLRDEVTDEADADMPTEAELQELGWLTYREELRRMYRSSWDADEATSEAQWTSTTPPPHLQGSIYSGDEATSEEKEP